MFKINFNKWIEHNSFTKASAQELFNEKLDDIIDENLIPIIKKNAKEKDRKLRFAYYLKNSIYQKPLFYYDLTENATISGCRCELCKTTNQCKHIIFGMMLDKNYTDEDIENLFVLEEEKINERLYNEKRKQYLEKLNPLLDEFEEYDQLSLLSKVDLEIYLETYRYQKDSESNILSLKIGNDKKYVIKDINEFLLAIKEQKYVSYGQKLAFKHSLENFTDRAQKILKALIKLYTETPHYEYYYIVEKKYLKLNPYLIDEIFHSYQNDVIKLFDDDYFVSLEEFDLNFTLNKKYIIEMNNYSYEDDYIIFGHEYIYLLKDSEVFKINLQQKDLLPLLKFVINNPKFSFKYIKDILSKEILSRFYQNITIDEKIKEEFDIKEYRIEAYFDYDGDFIKVTSKYYCDNEIIEEVDLSNQKEIISRKVARYLHILSSLGFNEKGILEDSLKIKAFLTTDLTELKKIAGVYLSEKLRNTQIKVLKPFKMHIKYDVNLLEVQLENNEYTNEELYKIIKGIKKKTRYVKLNKNTIVEIDEETGIAILNTINEFGLDPEHLTESQVVPSYLALKLADRNLNIISYNASDNIEQMISEIANYKNSPYNPPKEVVDVMRQYQIEAFKWMKTLIKYGFSGILADDMGLGKTLEMISIILDSEINKPVLIVCPKSLCYNWKNEFSKWAPHLKVVNVIGSIPERDEKITNINLNEKTIYITSYDSLRNDIELYENLSFSYLILDEAQYIKNHETQKAQSVKLIDSKYRFVLTGTPIENTILDLWSIFDFILPNYLGSYNDFRSSYEQQVMDSDKKTVNRLVKKITPFILRRTKKDVIKDLPDKVEVTITAVMNNEQRKIYEAELQRAKGLIEKGDNKIVILSAITRLRQICVDPSLYIENYSGTSSKLELLMETIENNIKENHRMIIFSQFTSVFENISNEFNKRNIKHFILTGKTSSKDRVELSEEFNKNEDIKVFLVSLKAGGTGLNLVGADIVIHLDPWWNVAAENQATDRAHRIGQKRVVQVIKMICENTIEQKVIELQNKKAEIVKLIVSDDDQQIQKLTLDDLRFILD